MIEIWFSSPASLLEGLRHAYRLASPVVVCVSLVERTLTFQSVETREGKSTHESHIPLWQHIVCGVHNRSIEVTDLEPEKLDSARFVQILRDSSLVDERRKSTIQRFIFNFGISPVYKELELYNPSEIYTIVARLCPDTREASWWISPQPEQVLYSRIMGADEVKRIFIGSSSSHSLPGARTLSTTSTMSSLVGKKLVVMSKLRKESAATTKPSTVSISSTFKKRNPALDGKPPCPTTGSISKKDGLDRNTASSLSPQMKGLFNELKTVASFSSALSPLVSLSSSSSSSTESAKSKKTHKKKKKKTSVEAEKGKRPRRRKGQDDLNLSSETLIAQIRFGTCDPFYVIPRSTREFSRSARLRLPVAELQSQLAELAIIGNDTLSIHIDNFNKRIIFSSRQHARDFIQYEFTTRAESLRLRHGRSPLPVEGEEETKLEAATDAAAAASSSPEKKRFDRENKYHHHHHPRGVNVHVSLLLLFLAINSLPNCHVVTLYFDPCLGVLAEWEGAKASARLLGAGTSGTSTVGPVFSHPGLWFFNPTHTGAADDEKKQKPKRASSDLYGAKFVTLVMPSSMLVSPPASPLSTYFSPSRPRKKEEEKEDDDEETRFRERRLGSRVVPFPLNPCLDALSIQPPLAVT